MEENKKTNSKKLWIWIIAGIFLLSGIGVITYLFWPKKSVESKLTNQAVINKQSIQAFQNQIQQIKQVQKNLNQEILKEENILEEMQKNAEQNRYVESEIKDIPRLQQNLTELKFKQAKIEQVLPKLEEKINSLSNENNPKQEAIREIEREISSLNQKLGIKETKQERPVNSQQKRPVAGYSSESSLVSDNIPQDSSNSSQIANKQNGSNLQEFQTLRNQAKELIEELEKIIKRDGEAINNWDSQEQQVKEVADNLVGGNMQKYINNLCHHLNIIKRNKSTLEGYVSEKDYQTFLSASSKTQKTNLSLIEDAIKHTLNSTKEYFQSVLDYCKIFTKFIEKMIEVMEQNVDQEQLNQAKQELQKRKDNIENCEKWLNELEQLSVPRQILTILKLNNRIKELIKTGGGE